MENPTTPQTSITGMITMWAITALTNFLAFTPTITLDDLQKCAAILASIVVMVFTIATYFRKRKK